MGAITAATLATIDEVVSWLRSEVVKTVQGVVMNITTLAVEKTYFDVK
tara:strand:- start:2004 stop:2147 length:144 start_codon:yes stop_codon:yes gene_type:complete